MSYPFNVRASDPGLAGLPAHLVRAEHIERDLLQFGHAQLPIGDVTLSREILLKAGDRVTGLGRGTRLLVGGNRPAFAPADGLRMDDVAIAGLSIQFTGTVGAASSQSDSAGVKILGNDVVLRDLWIEDAFDGVLTVDDAARSRRLALDNVHVVHSSASANASRYGIDLTQADAPTLINCTARGMWLDGLKIRKKCSGVTVIGGHYSNNGVSGAGDGIDGFAGGDGLTLIGVTMNDNVGFGLQFKTSEGFFEDYGYPRKLELIGCRARGNTYAGVTINRDQSTSTTVPLVGHVTIIGGLYEENGTNGIYLRCRTFDVSGVTVRRNVQHGCIVAPESFDGRLAGMFVANGNGATGYANVEVYGRRVDLDVMCVGKDDQDLAEDDFDGLSSLSDYGVIVRAAATNVKGRVRGHGHGSALVSNAGTGTDLVQA